MLKVFKSCVNSFAARTRTVAHGETPERDIYDVQYKHEGKRYVRGDPPLANHQAEHAASIHRHCGSKALFSTANSAAH